MLPRRVGRGALSESDAPTVAHRGSVGASSTPLPPATHKERASGHRVPVEMLQPSWQVAAHYLVAAAAALREAKHEPLTNDQEQQKKTRNVHAYAAAVEQLSELVAMRHSGMATFATVQQQAPAVDERAYNVVTTRNQSVDKRLHAFVPVLPNLLMTAGEDHQDTLVPAGPWSKQYAAEAEQRKAGASQARVARGKRGTLSLPHIDHDDRRRVDDAWMATYILMLRGEIVVVAWQHDELTLDYYDKLPLYGEEEGVTAQWPSVLARLRSLQVLRVCEGEMLHMPKGTVHMVVSTAQKLQLSWHLY